MSEIRYDRLHDTHVIIAPERLHRPECDIRDEPSPLDAICPFCEGNEELTPPEIFALRKADSFANTPGWSTRVVPNLYKAVQIEAPHRHHYAMFEYWEGFGAHEVIIDTPYHHTSMRQWSELQIQAWLKTLRQRVVDLKKDHRIAYISLFKNEGTEAGATQVHSHTQLIGLPLIPKNERERYHQSFEHFRSSGSALMASIVAQEESNAERIVAKEGAFTAFCPYASAYPFEVMISSKTEAGQIDTLDDARINEVATLLFRLFKTLSRQLECNHFNMSISTPPLQPHSVGEELYAQRERACRFTLRIMPRLYRQGGFEASTGVMINPVSPEMAAKHLRESMHE